MEGESKPTKNAKKAPFWLFMGILLDSLALILLIATLYFDPGSFSAYILMGFLLVLSYFAYVRWQRGSKILM